MSIEAMKQALEALEYMHTEKCDYMRRNKLGDPLREDAARLAIPAITALRTAIEQAEKQEPHSWYSPDLGDYTRTKPEMGEGVTWIALFDASTPLEARPAIPEGWKLVPIAEHIYNGACPEPASPDDRDPECPACRTMMNTQPAAPVQELEKGCHRSHPHENMDAMCELRTDIARLTNENARLKAAQRQWVGLTDEEIDQCRRGTWMATCRALEAKLMEKNT